jgi:hypothetical protein
MFIFREPKLASNWPRIGRLNTSHIRGSARNERRIMMGFVGVHLPCTQSLRFIMKSAANTHMSQTQSINGLDGDHKPKTRNAGSAAVTDSANAKYAGCLGSSPSPMVQIAKPAKLSSAAMTPDRIKATAIQVFRVSVFKASLECISSGAKAPFVIVFYCPG